MPVEYPRVEIEYCTGCKWNLRAGWLAQELLSTFGTTLGEVSLQPSKHTGIFKITVDRILETTIAADGPTRQILPVVIWDRKKDGGFPDSKDVKRLVRDIIDPNRNLGHVDSHQENVDDNGDLDVSCEI